MPDTLHPFDNQMARNRVRLMKMRKLYRRRQPSRNKEPLWQIAGVVGLLIGTLSSMTVNSALMKEMLEARIHLQMPQRPGIVEVHEAPAVEIDL